MVNNSLNDVVVAGGPTTSDTGFERIEMPAYYDLGSSKCAQSFVELLKGELDDRGVSHAVYVFES